jgi:hypothetical protein
MGKKKSKTGKQKQAKASKKFGVAVKQGKREHGQFVLNPKQRPQNNASSSSSSSKQCRNVVPNERTNNVSDRKARDPEHVEFDRQMASAQERTRRPGTKGKGQTLALAPATLVVDDKEKSTFRLLEETTVRFQQGFESIGNGPLTKKLPTWAVDDDQPTSLEVDNPYAVLGGDSTDEEGCAQPPLPLFRFAPPTLLVAATQDDVDPDL